MWRRILAMFRSKKMDRDLEQELETHLALLEEDYERRGLTREQARREARLTLGGVTSLREQHREVRGMPWIESFWQDFRYALRMLAKDRWLTAAAVTALALGIGVNAVGFTIVNTAFIKGIQAKDGDRLLAPCWPSNCRLSVEQLEFLREATTTVANWNGYSMTVVKIGDDRAFAEQMNAVWVTGNLFASLGYEPVRGRNLTADDDSPGAEPVALISYDIWTNRFGRNESVIGQALRLNGRPATIVGVMPEGFGFPDRNHIWAPWQIAQRPRDGQNLEIVGRLQDGATIEQARAELTDIAQRMAAAFPKNEFKSVRLQSFHESRGLGRARNIFLVVMGAVCFVLLIACANVANLLLSRSSYRVREMAVRMSLGATRWRLVRQLLIESLLLGLLGGGLGLLLAMAGVPLFEQSLQSSSKPYWLVFAVDYNVIAYVAGICVLTAILFGLAPALQLSRGANSALKEGGRGSAGGRKLSRLSGALVVTELTLAVVLLAGAGLLGRSFYNMYMLDLGFSPERLVMFGMDLFGGAYEDTETRRSFVNRLEENIAAIPGVEAATVTTGVPPRDRVERRLDLDRPDWEPPFVSTVAITSRFFDTLRMPLLRGRNFTAADGQTGSEAVLINERLAQQFFPGQDPIGQHLRFAPLRPGGKADVWRTIVGITPTIRQGSFQDGYLSAVVYTPYQQEADGGAYLVVRSGMTPGALSQAVRRVIQTMDPDQPLRETMTLEQWMAAERWPHRVFGGLFFILAAIALGLSSLGLYAVMAYGVTQRTQEIGVRMAIGAQQSQIGWLVMKRGLWQLAIGLVLGTIVGVGLSRVMSGILVEVRPGDPATFIGIGLLLALVSIAACLIPGRRAANIDPAVALRSE